MQELTKLRSKITNTVQVLTHLKEKLQFVNGENLVEKQRLHDVEELVAKVSTPLSDINVSSPPVSAYILSLIHI